MDVRWLTAHIVGFRSGREQERRQLIEGYPKTDRALASGVLMQAEARGIFSEKMFRLCESCSFAKRNDVASMFPPEREL